MIFEYRYHINMLISFFVSNKYILRPLIPLVQQRKIDFKHITARCELVILHVEACFELVFLQRNIKITYALYHTLLCILHVQATTL